MEPRTYPLQIALSGSNLRARVDSSRRRAPESATSAGKQDEGGLTDLWIGMHSAGEGGSG